MPTSLRSTGYDSALAGQDKPSTAIFCIRRESGRGLPDRRGPLSDSPARTASAWGHGPLNPTLPGWESAKMSPWPLRPLMAESVRSGTPCPCCRFSCMLHGTTYHV